MEQKTFKSCYFWNIESAERMQCCFESLISILENVTSQIAPFLLDDSVLLEKQLENYKIITGAKEEDLDLHRIEISDSSEQAYYLSLQKMWDGFIFARFCTFKPYTFLLKNKVNKGLKEYEKIRQHKLLEYEKQMVEYIRNSESRTFQVFDAACDTSVSEKLLVVTSWIKAFLTIFCISSALLCGLVVLYNFIISSGTVLTLSAPWYCGFLSAAFCSVFGAAAFFAYMPNKHFSKTEQRNFSKILFSKGVRKLSFVVFSLSVAASVFFTVMIMTANVRFYDDTIKFGEHSYHYRQIDSVYRIDARYNMYDERIERASYVILFDDKTSLDLDGYTSVDITEKEVIPLMKRKGIVIKMADSEKELPWYTAE